MKTNKIDASVGGTRGPDRSNYLTWHGNQRLHGAGEQIALCFMPSQLVACSLALDVLLGDFCGYLLNDC